MTNSREYKLHVTCDCKCHQAAAWTIQADNSKQAIAVMWDHVRELEKHASVLAVRIEDRAGVVVWQSRYEYHDTDQAEQLPLPF
jgi:phage I-like protein